MDFKNITETELRALLKRYFAAETELDEEALLRRYFTENTHIPEDLKPYQSLFSFWKQEQSIKSQKNLSAPLPRLRPWWLLSAAAAVLLLVGFAWAMAWSAPAASDTLAEQKKVEQQRIFNNTKAALLLVSSKIQKGKKRISNKKI